MILLDTHIWLWWLLGGGGLTELERTVLDELASDRKLAISWVTVWETEMLERKKRIDLLPDLKQWLGIAISPEICTLLPVDVDVVLAQRLLPETFPNDPADRLIASTALLSGYKLATHDRKIRVSDIVPVWNP